MYALSGIYNIVSGRYTTVTDLLLVEPLEIAKKCKLQHAAVVEMLDTVCSEFMPKPRTLDTIPTSPGIFTTGDNALDAALGGGIRTGMVWEVVGERLALMSLFLDLVPSIVIPQ